MMNVRGLLYGGDYNPEQWLEQKDTIWKKDMEYAKRAGINTLSIGIFAWSQLEPEDGRYTFSWMDEVMDMLAENDIKAILATPSGSRPPWLAKKYPSVLRVNAERQTFPYGGRHNACVSSPDFRRKVTEINTRLAERYATHPALGMWHVSNEYNNECHCPLCQEQFRQWLKARYGDIDTLNHAWWNRFWSHRYNDFDEIVSPTFPSRLGEWESTGQILAWKRFCSDNLIDFFQMECEPLRRLTPNVPITTNMMGTFTGIDYFKLGRAMDVASWDNYPAWRGDERDEDVSAQSAFKHDLMRGTCAQKPFLMMESSPSSVNWHEVNTLRAPGTIMFQGLQAVAHGSDSVQYFQMRAGRGGSEQFHGAVIDRSGSDQTRVFREAVQVGSTLNTLAPIAGSAARNDVALVYDWENRWALDNAWLANRWNQKYEETVMAHHASVSAASYGVDIVDQTASLSGYRFVVAPMSFMLRDGFAEKLKTFVTEGGALVLTYLSGYVNAENLTFEGGSHPALRELTGVSTEEVDAFDAQRTNHFDWRGGSYPIREVAELSHAEEAKVLAVYEEQFYRGMPYLTVNHFGKGCCYYIAARANDEFLCDFYRWALADAGLTPFVADVSKGVTVTCRRGEQSDFLFLLNNRHQPGWAVLHEPARDMLTDERLEGRCEVPPLSVRTLEVHSNL